MAIYTGLPTLEADFLAPLKATFDVAGSSIEGGRSGSGQTISIEMSGGGIVTATYDDCKITEREQFEYINMLGARMNGSFRFINVPIVSDWYGPFPFIGGRPTPIVSGVPHSDGSYFDDGSGYSQGTVWGKITASAALNAGIVRMRVYGMARDLRWSDWFSIFHATKGWRAYRYWEIVERYADGVETVDGAPIAYQEYRLALAPPLREAVTSGTRVEFARPRFVARFPAGFTLPSVVEAFYVTQQSIQFTEAF